MSGTLGMESPIEKKQRLEHRDEGMEEMPKIIKDDRDVTSITQEYMRGVIKTLENDIEMYDDPMYEDNPKVIAIRTALGAVIYALKRGL